MKIDLNSPETLVRKDKKGQIRKINHFKNPVKTDGKEVKKLNPKELSIEYIKTISPFLKIERQIENIERKPSLNLEKDELEIHFNGDKIKENLSLISFYQTFFGIKLWKSSFSLRIDRINLTILNFLSSINYDEINIDKPTEKELSNYSNITTHNLAKINKSKNLYVFKYTKKERLGLPLKENNKSDFKQIIKNLPRVTLEENSFRIVREVLFSSYLENLGLAHWRCLVDVQNGDVLYLLPFVFSIDGLVFKNDPITMGNNVNVDDSNSVLNPV